MERKERERESEWMSERERERWQKTCIGIAKDAYEKSWRNKNGIQQFTWPFFNPALYRLCMHAEVQTYRHTFSIGIRSIGWCNPKKGIYLSPFFCFDFIRFLIYTIGKQDWHYWFAAMNEPKPNEWKIKKKMYAHKFGMHMQYGVDETWDRLHDINLWLFCHEVWSPHSLIKKSDYENYNKQMHLNRFLFTWQIMC